MNIFICEKDPYRAKLMQDLLAVYNFKIITVMNQGELIRKTQSKQPALIVMHDRFAKDTGSAMLQQLRKNARTATIPVIYIKDEAHLDLREEATPYDAFTEFVNGPVKIKNLRHYIDRWTTLRSLYIKH